MATVELEKWKLKMDFKNVGFLSNSDENRCSKKLWVTVF